MKGASNNGERLLEFGVGDNVDTQIEREGLSGVDGDVFAMLFVFKCAGLVFDIMADGLSMSDGEGLSKVIPFDSNCRADTTFDASSSKDAITDDITSVTMVKGTPVIQHVTPQFPSNNHSVVQVTYII